MLHLRHDVQALIYYDRVSNDPSAVSITRWENNSPNKNRSYSNPSRASVNRLAKWFVAAKRTYGDCARLVVDDSATPDVLMYAIATYEERLGK